MPTRHQPQTAPPRPQRAPPRPQTAPPRPQTAPPRAPLQPRPRVRTQNASAEPGSSSQTRWQASSVKAQWRTFPGSQQLLLAQGSWSSRLTGPTTTPPTTQSRSR
ncbi:MAG TPA: hypothetical protein DEG43_11610 [Acidimicrobiaceae bacterium]|nr:hypothetical protein [Acidimicrobiaceae bacterium]